jgi:aminopeptidase N
MNHRYTALWVLLFFLFQSAYAQESLVYESGGELIYEQAAYDVYHYDLDLKINPADSTIAGVVVVRADFVHPTNVIVLDLDPRFEIESIRDLSQDGQNKLHFARSDESKRVRIYFPQTRQPGEQFEIAVNYHGKPMTAANPPWDGGFVWDQTPSGEPWIGVACQTIGAWVWWPNKDHQSDKPDSVSLNFTLPENLEVVSNGRFRGTSDAGDGWKTWHWFNSTPISNYNVTLNAAPYKTISEAYRSVAGDEMEITFWVLPEYYEQGKELFPQFPEQMRFLEEILGPYPFRADKYGVAHVPYLGMEHQSIIAYGANFRDGALFGRSAVFDDLHQHELAHEWWGNMVSAWDWRDFWIHEGFGSYMQALYAEHLGGEKAYHQMMEVFRQQISSRQEIAPREFMTTVEVYGTGRGGDIYFKGAAFLHTLRYVMGDELFFKSLRRFAYPTEELEFVTDGSHVRFVTTDDYLTLVNDLTGEDYSWLFEVYLRRAELPVLSKTRTDDTLILEWSTVDDLPFPMPVEIFVDGERKVLIPEEGRMVLGLPDQAVVEIDPDEWILKDIQGNWME